MCLSYQYKFLQQYKCTLIKKISSENGFVNEIRETRMGKGKVVDSIPNILQGPQQQIRYGIISELWEVSLQ